MIIFFYNNIISFKWLCQMSWNTLIIMFTGVLQLAHRYLTWKLEELLAEN